MNGSNHEEQIIIVRRNGEHEEGHHGGAWKIAFADFMTAMMALFLVLWLVNAANEESKQAVASYFNPVKLVDTDQSTRGLMDDEGLPTNTLEGTSINGGPNSQGIDQPSASGFTDTQSSIDSEFFHDPIAHLDEIVVTAFVDAQAGQSSLTGQESSEGQGEFADPFAPNFWQSIDTAATESDAVVSNSLAPMQSNTPRDNGMAAGMPHDGVGGEPGETGGVSEGEDASGLAQAVPPIPQELLAEADSPEIDEEMTQRADEIAEAIRLSVAEMGETADGLDVQVRAESEGVSISLSEGIDQPMFALGSAVPTAAAVLVVDTIGKVLKEEPGTVRIEGHTDGHPITTPGDDNWRLSLDRARSIYFMLLRGGLEEDRVGGITGYADRRLKIADDPMDGRNRRIEIRLDVS